MSIEAVNLLLVTALSVSTVFLIVVGVYLVRVLRELEELTIRANRISKKTERVVTYVEESVNGVQDISQGIGYIAGLVRRFTGAKRDSDEK